MTPIQDVLHRIRWDPGYGNARFELGYVDRVEGALVHVPFAPADFPTGEHFFVDVVAPDGSAHAVPLHRIREVWRDGVLVWHRAADDPAGRGAGARR
jgi:uncharacterized protein (UPF0248 family)